MAKFKSLVVPFCCALLLAGCNVVEEGDTGGNNGGSENDGGGGDNGGGSSLSAAEREAIGVAFVESYVEFQEGLTTLVQPVYDFAGAMETAAANVPQDKLMAVMQVTQAAIMQIAGALETGTEAWPTVTDQAFVADGITFTDADFSITHNGLVQASGTGTVNAISVPFELDIQLPSWTDETEIGLHVQTLVFGDTEETTGPVYLDVSNTASLTLRLGDSLANITMSGEPPAVPTTGAILELDIGTSVLRLGDIKLAAESLSLVVKDVEFVEGEPQKLSVEFSGRGELSTSETYQLESGLTVTANVQSPFGTTMDGGTTFPINVSYAFDTTLVSGDHTFMVEVTEGALRRDEYYDHSHDDDGNSGTDEDYSSMETEGSITLTHNGEAFGLLYDIEEMHHYLYPWEVQCHQIDEHNHECYPHYDWENEVHNFDYSYVVTDAGSGATKASIAFFHKGYEDALAEVRVDDTVVGEILWQDEHNRLAAVFNSGATVTIIQR